MIELCTQKEPMDAERIAELEAENAELKAARLDVLNGAGSIVGNIADAASSRIADLEREVAELRKVAQTFLAKHDECSPVIDNLFVLNFARTGVQYSGPNYGAEIAALRLAAEPQREQG